MQAIFALGFSVLTVIASARGEESSRGFLNKLIAPGPLMEAHKDLEDSQCLKCHSAKAGVLEEKCLACHSSIRAEVAEKKSFHGTRTEGCIHCHTDHRGRAFDSTRVDPRGFDHRETGFELLGKHRELRCEKCHLEKRSQAKLTNRPGDPRYIGLKATCISCHRKNDPHLFQGNWAKKDCGECHRTKSWKGENSFDHEKATRFKLIGKHAKMACASCHVPVKGGPSRYAWKAIDSEKCLACHKDRHPGRLSKRFAGGNCVACHASSQLTWKIEKFDHQVTGYPLQGAHASLKCVQCHKQGGTRQPTRLADFRFVGLKPACLTCHQDKHQFGARKSSKLGPLGDCRRCHSEAGWKKTHDFDHGRDTGFALSGKHLALDCSKCHVLPAPKAKERVYHWQDLGTKSCATCHQSPHQRNFGAEFQAKKCADCHVAEGWNIFNRNGKRFSHDEATRFPLKGRHAEIACASCHRSGKTEVFQFPLAEKGFCLDCHESPHLKQFNRAVAEKSCSECHSTESFAKLANFKHDTTDFKLTGKHLSLSCDKCHVPTREMFPARPSRPPHPKARFLFEGKEKQYCANCHKNPHLEQFHPKFAERGCASCHTTDDFRRRLAFDHRETAFQLTGKHEGLECAKCHRATGEKIVPDSPTRRSHFVFPELRTQDCATCHRDPHGGKFGKKCSECHQPQAWKRTNDFHKNFMLSGVHYSLQCTECHKNGRRLGGIGDRCVFCHQKDDIHNGTLPNCGTCHRQQFWENAEFKHSLSGFPLRGAHRTLDCYSCHARGIYKGTPSQCVNCHLSDALAFPGPPNHSVLLGRACNECHNLFSFR